jgi:hypothetical protein
MIKVIRRYQKTFAAVMGVFLMLMFAFTSGNKGSGSEGHDDHQVGTITSGKVMSSDLAYAKEEVEILRTSFPVGDPMENQGLPLLGAISQKPETFYLLKKEAEQAGVRAGVDQVGNLMRLYSPSDKDTADPDRIQFARVAAADYVAIMARFEQVRGYAKVTEPAVDQKLAEVSQKVTFNVVPISADLYKSATTKPTDAAMQKQFEQFAAIAPGTPSEPGNPFGFGYRLPMKQGIQYLQYNRDDLEKGVIARTNYDWPSAKTPVDQIVMDMKVIDYYWRVAGQKFYLEHPDKFTKSLTADGPGVLEPITDPAVLADAIKQVRDPMIVALDAELRAHLGQVFDGDWKVWQAWLVGGSKGPEPVTAVGVPYDSADYLPKLAAAVSKDPAYMVPVTAGQSAGDVTDEDIATTKPYGSKELEVFAITTADQYLKAPDAKKPEARADLMKVSSPLDSLSPATTMPTEAPREVATTCFARLSDVQPSVAPANLAAVAGQVEKDLRFVESYQLAQNDAEKLLAASAKSNLQLAKFDFPQLAKVETDPLSASMEQARRVPEFRTQAEYEANELAQKLDAALAKIQPPVLNTDQQVSFVKLAFATLETYNARSKPHPSKIVRIPTAAVVYVVEVNNVTADLGGNQFYIAALNVRDGLRNQMSQPLVMDWFNLEKISARIGYKPMKG